MFLISLVYVGGLMFQRLMLDGSLTSVLNLILRFECSGLRVQADEHNDSSEIHHTFLELHFAD